jgi:hypothetical protein
MMQLKGWQALSDGCGVAGGDCVALVAWMGEQVGISVADQQVLGLI